MRVYDFDGTIYDGDSTVDLFFYTIARHPAALRKLPGVAAGYLKWLLGRGSKTAAKGCLYALIYAVPDPQRHLEEFWDAHQKKLKPWYLRQQAPDDVIISASPDFSLRVIAGRLGQVELIASPTDLRTGKPTGPNNDGAAKVQSFRKRHPLDQIGEFYSDSRHDRWLAAYAGRAYLVSGSRIRPW